MIEKFTHKSEAENNRLDVVPKFFLGHMKLLRAIATASFVLLPGGSQDASLEAHTGGLIKIESASEGEVSLLLDGGDVVTLPSIENLSVTREVFLPKDQIPDSVVILIKQNHSASDFGDMSFDGRQEVLARTVESQSIQYNVLQNLVEQKVVESVCAESFADDDPEIVLDYSQSRLAFLQYSRLEEYFEEADGSSVKHEITSSTLEENRFIIGGALTLATEGKISLCSAENANLMKAIEEEFFTKEGALKPDIDKNRYKKMVHEQREDMALKYATSLREQVVAVTFGAGHDFTDATARWNLTHPDNILGLVVLDPILK